MFSAVIYILFTKQRRNTTFLHGLLADGDKEKVKKHLSMAKNMIKKMGYHRRDVEVRFINAGIALADGDKTTAQGHLSDAKRIIDENGLHGWDWEVKELEAKLMN